MQVLTSHTTDLILMAMVASAMVWHSLRYKSQVVTAFAFLLAFATVGISHVTLFSLVSDVILAGALVFIAAREFWFELSFAGLCGVYINHFVWLLRVLSNGVQIGQSLPELFPSAGLLLLYWLLFGLFYIFRIPQDRRQELIASVTAILNSAGLLALLKHQSAHPEWAFRPWSRGVRVRISRPHSLADSVFGPRDAGVRPHRRRNSLSVQRLKLNALVAF